MSTLASKPAQSTDVSSRMFQHTRRALSAGACSAILAGTMLLGGGWPSSLAYADGYVDGSGNNVYYGFKTDASYTEGRFHIEVTYYDTLEHAKEGGDQGQDPLGKFVRVHYLSNCNKEGGTADDWRFRPMWWYGVPKGLQNVQNIIYTRVEKLTNQRGNQPFRPAGSSQFTFTDGNGYGVVSHKTYQTPEDWKGISNFYFKDDKVLASKGWKQLLGLNGGTYDNVGNTAGQWESYQKETDGLQGIFVDWESAGQRFYDMTYVGEMTKEAWENRDKNPLRFAAGVYRFAGNWHYAVGQKHDTPKIADHIGLKYPELTPVKDLKNVSTDEQKTIKEKIEKANESTKYFKELVADNGVAVNKDGSATITFKDKTTRTISADLLVFKNEDDKDKYKPIMPARTPVVNPSKLTADDKKAVIAAFKEKNKDNKDFNDHVKADPDGIKFNDDGTKLVVTYKDGSKLEIDASELVCQGATIADWAPYVVPDYIEVDDLKKLKQEEITKIVNAFDTANTGITPYDKAKTKNGNTAPVAVDPNTGNATITWEDGSTTTIPAWQFLKEKAKQNPEPSTPTQQGDKTFIVEAPAKQTRVKFDPFKMTEADLTNQTNTQALNGAKTLYIGEKGKDAKDPTKKVNIKSVEYSVKDGVGYITFKADGYKDAEYPMSVFFKKDPSVPTPQTPSTETKTETDNDNPGDTFTYKVTKTEIDGNNPTAPDAIKAMKQFVKDNYDNVKDSDLDGVSDSISIKTTWTPKQGTVNMGAWDNTSNCGPVTSIQPSDDFGIQVNGHQWEDDDNGGGWSAGMEGTLFTIKASDLYVKKGSAQPQKDTTIDDLKKQAKALLDKRRNTDKLTNDDLKRAGIENPDQLNDAKIDSMAQGQTAEKDLRDLIRKLTDAKKAERKYNPISEIEVTDPEHLSEADFKKAVEAFLKANYDGTDSLAVDKVPYTVPTSLKPKTDTVLMEPASDTNATGISTIKYTNSDFKTLIFSDKNKNQLFTVSVNYKKNGETPAPTPDALAQMKKDAEQQIDRNPNLTKEQKEDYKKQIEEATTPDKIKEILKNAAEKGKENAKSTDPNTQATINKNKGGGDAKKEAEKKQKENEEKQKEQKLQEDKKKASEEIDTLDNLTPDEKNKLKEQINGTGTGQDPDGAKTPEEVQTILNNAKAINDARGALQNDAAKGALPFLDHGNAADDKKDQPSHADDAALKELLGSTGKDATLTALETALAKTNPAATAAELKQAVAAAKQANARNEQKAKDAANKQLTEKKDALDNAYNALTDQQKNSAKAKYDAAIAAINTAKTSVNDAKKPSDIKTALDGVKTSFDDANNAIKDAKGTRDTSGNTNDNADALNKEKTEQKKRIQDSDLPEADKQKAIDDINNAKKIGDPTGIANHALKAQKIKDALKKIDDFKHLNKAQKDAFKAIINDTDAGNHTNDDGTTSDDIDDALANATATDDAMARLEKLKEIADKFAKGEKYKGLQDGDDKKKAFDDASTAAGAVLDKAKGDAKNADQVNELYKDLLKAMQAIDDKVKGAGVNTDALSKEIEADKGLKPNDKADPKTPGDPLYTTASKDKKDAFDQALTAAEEALKKAKEDNANQEKPGTTPRTPEQEAKDQKAVDDALQKLEEARKALDGVNTKPLQDAVANADETHKDVKYTNASKDKRDAYDKAVNDGKDLLDKLNGTTQAQPGQGGQQPGGQQQPGQGGQQQDLSTKEAKQNALDAALKKIEDAKAALDGAAPMSGYPLIAVIPSGSIDNGNAQAPSTQPDNTGAAAPSAEAAPAAPGASSAPSADATANANANGNASTEAGAASDSSESDDASEAAAVAPSRTKGHGKHAGIAQTSDPFALGGLAAPFAALAGALSLGAAGSRKRLRSAKHLKR